jgi:hypothetical protein
MSARQDFHDACKILRAQIENGTHIADTGICSNLEYIDKYQDDISRLVSYYSKSWEHFSGDGLYPVPSPDSSTTPHHAFFLHRHDDKMWTGAYGEYRRDLLEHLINRSEYSTFTRLVRKVKSILRYKYQ